MKKILFITAAILSSHLLNAMEYTITIELHTNGIVEQIAWGINEMKSDKIRATHDYTSSGRLRLHGVEPNILSKAMEEILEVDRRISNDTRKIPSAIREFLETRAQQLESRKD